MNLAERMQKALDGAPGGPLNPYQVEQLCGFSRSTMSLILNGITKDIKLASARRLERVLNVRGEWLADGTPPMREGDDESSTLGPQSHSENDDDLWADVRGYSLAMGLGKGTDAEEYAEAHKLKFRADSLRKKGLYSRRLAVWEGKGDSMLEIKHGDAVMFDEGDTTPIDGELYVIRIGTSSEYQCKKAMVLDGVTYFCATNPDGDHSWKKPRRLDDRKNPIHVAGRAWWVGRWLA